MTSDKKFHEGLVWQATFEGGIGKDHEYYQVYLIAPDLNEAARLIGELLPKITNSEARLKGLEAYRWIRGFIV